MEQETEAEKADEFNDHSDQEDTEDAMDSDEDEGGDEPCHAPGSIVWALWQRRWYPAKEVDIRDIDSPTKKKLKLKAEDVVVS